MEDDTIEWGKRVVIEDLSEDDAVFHFRFRKADLKDVADRLWPRLTEYLGDNHEHVTVINRYSMPYETLLLLVLYRFSRPRRLRKEMEGFFGMRKSKISAGIDTMIDALHKLSLKYLDNPHIFYHRMPYYARKVYEKCGLVQNVWGFIDGTFRKTCRPSYFQRLAYSGHKRCHGIKFQSVVTPDGLYAHFYGPIAGNRHDASLLNFSNLLPKLALFMPDDGTFPVVYSLYGDPAYPNSVYLFCGFWNPLEGTLEAFCNTCMSKVRIAVEWGFNQILQQWSFLDFRPAKKIFHSPVAQYYMVGAFLINLRTCYYGNQAMVYFDCDTLSITQYL